MTLALRAKKNWRRFLLALVAASFVLSPGRVSRSVLAAERFTVANSALNIFGTPIWLAKEKAFFFKYGLEVEDIYIPSGTQAMQALLSGDVKAAVAAGTAAASSRLQGAPIKIIAGVANYYTSAFFTGDDDKTIEGLQTGEVDFALDPKTANVLRARARGDDIAIIGGWLNRFFYGMVASKEVRKVKDLKGKKFGVRVVNTGIEWLPAREIIRLQGLDPDRDVEYVVAGMATAGNSREPLLRGEY